MTGRRWTALGRVTVVGLLVTGMAGCSWLRNTFDPSNVDYKSAKSGPGLDVPPDLIGPKGDDRYVVPEAGAGRTYSDYSRNRRDQTQQAQQAQQQAAVATAAANPQNTVLPVTDGAHLERDGAIRWLVVDQPPEQVWPQVVAFWESEGMPLDSQNPSLGTMDTQWVTRTERPERSGIRGALSRAMGSTYTTSMKDAYRTRLDRAPNGGTEIYVSQRALEEVVNSPRQDSTIWQPGPNRPDLEVEMLRRMMLRIGKVNLQQSRDAVAAVSGGSGAVAASGASVAGGAAAGGAAMAGAGAAGATGAAVAAGATAAAATDRPERATVFADQGGLNGLRVNEGYERAWREVGLAIDRIGFTVEDRDRSKGTYFVRYVDLDRRDPRQGAMSRLFSGERKDLAGQRYQIRVEGEGNDSSRVEIRSDAGVVPSGDADVRVSNRIIALLHERIR